MMIEREHSPELSLEVVAYSSITRVRDLLNPIGQDGDPGRKSDLFNPLSHIRKSGEAQEPINLIDYIGTPYEVHYKSSFVNHPTGGGVYISELLRIVKGHKPEGTQDLRDQVVIDAHYYKIDDQGLTPIKGSINLRINGVHFFDLDAERALSDVFPNFFPKLVEEGAY